MWKTIRRLYNFCRVSFTFLYIFLFFLDLWDKNLYKSLPLCILFLSFSLCRWTLYIFAFHLYNFVWSPFFFFPFNFLLLVSVSFLLLCFIPTKTCYIGMYHTYLFYCFKSWSFPFSVFLSSLVVLYSVLLFLSCFVVSPCQKKKTATLPGFAKFKLKNMSYNYSILLILQSILNENHMIAPKLHLIWFRRSYNRGKQSRPSPKKKKGMEHNRVTCMRSGMRRRRYDLRGPRERLYRKEARGKGSIGAYISTDVHTAADSCRPLSGGWQIACMRSNCLICSAWIGDTLCDVAYGWQRSHYDYVSWRPGWKKCINTVQSFCSLTF